MVPSPLQRMSGFLKVFRCGSACNFAVRAGVWPALTNLGRRKQRGLVATYGERALAVGADSDAGAASSFSDALAVVIFRHLDREHTVDWALGMQLRLAFWTCHGLMPLL